MHVDRFVAAESLHLGEDFQVLSAGDFGVARRDFENLHTAGGHGVRPRHQHPFHRRGKVLRRKHTIERADRHHRHQHITEPQECCAVDNRVERHFRQTLGRLLFDGLINFLRKLLSPTAQE